MVEITETFFARDRAAWRAWLQEHHADKPCIWLILLKKSVPEPHLSLQEAIEEAVCLGWVDSQLRRIDDRQHALRFSPRRPGGVWAESNKARVDKLMAEGRMTPAGLAVIEAAKASGDWDSLPTNAQLDVVPDDLREALDADGAAGEAFAALAPSMRRQYVHWVTSAKRPETRARRVAETVQRARHGLR